MCKCFPWTWTEYEDPLDKMPEQSVWVNDGTSWQLQQLVSQVTLLAFFFSFNGSNRRSVFHLPLSTYSVAIHYRLRKFSAATGMLATVSL